MRHAVLFATLTAIAAPVWAQETAPAAPTYDAGTVVAVVDGTEITLGHMIMLRSRLPAEYQNLPDETLFPGILDQLIDQTLLSASEQAGSDTLPYQVQLALENERRALLATTRINKIVDLEITEDQIQAAYLEAFTDVQPEKEWKAAHILVATEDEAKAVVAALDDGGDFAALALERSLDSSKVGGGDLGWFSSGMMVGEFENAVRSMEPGTYSAPIQTQYGWHVIMLNETRDKALPTIDDVRAELIAGLQQQALEDNLTELRAAASIDRPETGVPMTAIREVDLVAIPKP